MATLYIMCGLAFAGKTTVARALARHTGGRVVSLDEINAARGLCGGDGIPATEWERTHDIALREADALLARGVATVVDDTGCYRWLRDRYRQVAARHGCNDVVVFVDTPPAEARRRRDANAATGARPGVRLEVFEALARTFEPPQPDETTITFVAGDAIAPWLERQFPRPR
jgi:predicted kinase